MQLSVQRVLDDRDAPGLRQRCQALLMSDRHAGAQRIMHTRDGDDGLDAFFGEQKLQRIERNTVVRVCRHLDGAQAKMLDQRNQIEIGGRLDRHRIAGLSESTQGELQRLHTAVSQNDVLRL